MQGVLAARIDRLAPDEKALLQQLAVIGREFPLSLLRQVIPQPEEELYRLLVLAPAQRVSLRAARVSRGGVHLQACADAGSRLQLGAAGAAQSLTRTHGASDRSTLPRQRLEDHYSELAHHYSRSGNTQKAVEYLHLAGQQAVQRSANAEAITHLTTALELLTDPARHPRAHPARTHAAPHPGVPLMATKGFAAPEVEATYTRARELCQQVGETPQLFPVLFGLWAFYQVRGELHTARELGEQLLVGPAGTRPSAPPGGPSWHWETPYSI